MRIFVERLALSITMAMGLLSAAYGQSPGLTPERFGSDLTRPDRPSLEPQPQPRFNLPPVPERKKRQGPGTGQAFQLIDVKLIGNKTLANDKLAEITKDYIGKDVTVADLLDLRDLITSTYIENGYVSSGAVLPDQKIKDGIVTIRIVEGGLPNILVDGIQALDVSFIKDRLTFKAKVPLDVNDLQERIQLLITDPAIDQINASLSPGGALGDSRLSLKIKEAPQYRIDLGLANDRSPSVGAERASAKFRVGNVLGYSDPLTAEFGLAEGLRDLGISYSTTVYPDDTRVFTSLSLSDSDVVEKPFSEIDVESKSQSFSIGVSKPLVKTLANEIRIDASLERKRSTTFLLGRRFSFSEGVRDGRSNVSAFRFTQQWQYRGRDTALALRSRESIGVDFLGATNNDGDVPDGQFFAWLGQVQYAKRLDWLDWQFAFRGDIQLTNEGLLPIERIAIGGANTVRGYRENQLVVDNGWVASAELRIPLGRVKLPGVSSAPGDGLVQVVPFFDAGGGWNKETPDPEDQELYSVGAGLRWRIGSKLDVGLDIGVPLKTVPDPDDEDLQDLGVHFRIRKSFY